MKGRKPKPTAAKKLAGNPGKRKLNEAEPTFGAPANLDAPDHLSDKAKDEWDRLAGELSRAGVLTTVDTTTLAAYCEAFAQWVDAKAIVATDGLTIDNAMGATVVHPAVRIADISVKQMVRLASELGITPASRSKVKAQAPKQEESLADLLFGNVKTKAK